MFNSSLSFFSVVLLTVVVLHCIASRSLSSRSILSRRTPLISTPSRWTWRWQKISLFFPITNSLPPRLFSGRSRKENWRNGCQSNDGSIQCISGEVTGMCTWRLFPFMFWDVLSEFEQNMAISPSHSFDELNWWVETTTSYSEKAFQNVCLDAIIV